MQLPQSIWQLFFLCVWGGGDWWRGWGGGINMRLSAGHCGVYHMRAWPQWSAQLCSASIPAAAAAAATQGEEPPLHNQSAAKHHPHHHHQSLSCPLPRAKLPFKRTQRSICRMTWADTTSHNVVFILSPLSLSLSRNEFISTQAQKIGDEAGAPIGIQRGEEDTIKKKRAYRRKKSQINPSESPGGLFGDIFLLSVSVFPSHWRGIAVGYPSLPIQELLSPPCVQMMTMAASVKFAANPRTQLPRSIPPK